MSRIEPRHDYASPPDHLVTHLAGHFRLLGVPLRVKILSVLYERPLTAAELQRVVD